MRFHENSRDIILNEIREQNVQQALAACRNGAAEKNDFQFAVSMQALILKIGKIVSYVSCDKIAPFDHCREAAMFLCSEVIHSDGMYDSFLRNCINVAANVSKHDTKDVKVDFDAVIAYYNIMLTEIDRALRCGNCFEELKLRIPQAPPVVPVTTASVAPPVVEVKPRKPKVELEPVIKPVEVKETIPSPDGFEECIDTKVDMLDIEARVSAKFVDFPSIVNDKGKELLVFSFEVDIVPGKMIRPRLGAAAYLTRFGKHEMLPESKKGIYSCAIPVISLPHNKLELKLVFTYDCKVKQPGHLFANTYEKSIPIFLRKRFF